MPRRIGYLQHAILTTLKKAGATEPYPVWMSWYGLLDRLSRSRSEMNNVRRAARDLPELQEMFSGYRDTAGIGFRRSPSHTWLLRHLQSIEPRTGLPVDSPRYLVPTPVQLREALRLGCTLAPDPTVDLAAVVQMVNDFGRTGAAEPGPNTFDLPEVQWACVGIKHERHHALEQLAAGLRTWAAEREQAEVEARKVTTGPFRIDPEAPGDRCPCCLREFTADAPWNPTAISAVAQRDGSEQAVPVSGPDQSPGSMPVQRLALPVSPLEFGGPGFERFWNSLPVVRR